MPVIRIRLGVVPPRTTFLRLGKSFPLSDLTIGRLQQDPQQRKASVISLNSVYGSFVILDYGAKVGLEASLCFEYSIAPGRVAT